MTGVAPVEINTIIARVDAALRDACANPLRCDVDLDRIANAVHRLIGSPANVTVECWLDGDTVRVNLLPSEPLECIETAVRIGTKGTE